MKPQEKLKLVIAALDEVLGENKDQLDKDTKEMIGLAAVGMAAVKPPHCEACAIQQLVNTVLDLIMLTAPHVEIEKIDEALAAPIDITELN